MRRVFIGLIIIVIIAVARYKALSFLPGSITGNLVQSLEKVSGRDPQKTIIEFYSELEEKEYQKASEVFASSSRKFYNPEYLQNIFTGSGKPKISRVDNQGTIVVIYYETENNRSLMANLIKENGTWKIRDISDDPNVTVD